MMLAKVKYHNKVESNHILHFRDLDQDQEVEILLDNLELNKIYNLIGRNHMFHKKTMNLRKK